MSTTAQVTAGSLATIITSTDGSFNVLSANSSTGVVTSGYMSSRITSYLTSRVQGLLTLAPTLSVATAFQGLLTSLVYISQAESNIFTIAVSQSGSTFTLSVSGLQSLSHVFVSVQHSIESPFTSQSQSAASQARLTGRSVAEFGVVGNGIANDTVALQASLTWASTSLMGGQQIYIPYEFRCRITSTVLIDSCQGVTFVGPGMYAGGIIWDGTAGNPVLRIRNSQYVTVSDMEIRGVPGAKKPSSCIESLMETVGGYVYVSTGNAYRNLLIGGGIPNLADSADYGIVHKKNGSDFNNSEGYFERIIVSGITEDCFSLQHPQSKAHTFIHCNTSGGKSGVSTVLGGAFRWYAGNMSGHTVAAFDLGAPNDVILVSGLNSESCVRMLKTSGAASAAWPVTFDTCRMSTDQCHADGLFMKYSDTGPLHVKDCMFDSSPPGGVIPLISLEWSAGTSRTAIIENNVFLAVGSNTVSPVVITGGNGRVIERQNSFNAGAGVAVQRIEQGSLQVAAGATTAAVSFAIPTYDTRYRINIGPQAVSAGATAGSSRIRSIAKATSGFTITVEAAPGGAETVDFDWDLQW